MRSDNDSGRVAVGMTAIKSAADSSRTQALKV